MPLERSFATALSLVFVLACGAPPEGADAPILPDR